MKKYHLIAGLPRSGSTLLSSILNQNPKFYASVSSPLQHYVHDVIHGTYNDFGYRVSVNDQKLIKIIQGLFDNYYYDIDKEVCFNTGRAWHLLFSTAVKVFPNIKMICSVRNIVEIVNSFELLYQKNPLNISTLYGPYRDHKGEQSPTFHTHSVYERTMHMANLIERCLQGLREVYYGPHKNCLFLVEYDDLCQNPENVMNKLYDFLEEPRFKHNFNEIESSFDEYDERLNAAGMHKVKRAVEYDKRNLILPPDIVNRFKGKEFWRNTRFT